MNRRELLVGVVSVAAAATLPASIVLATSPWHHIVTSNGKYFVNGFLVTAAEGRRWLADDCWVIDLRVWNEDEFEAWCRIAPEPPR